MSGARRTRSDAPGRGADPQTGPPRERVDIIAIGVSTGGPKALSALLADFPAALPVPIVIVQHMPPTFTRLLAERLDEKLPIRVSEAKTGERLVPGRAWLAPGDHHMTVVRNGADVSLLVSHGPRENSCRPSIDVLFRSVARVYGAHALAVVLTGMGHDGLHGCREIREAGGQVLVQDEATSVVWGMPRSVAEAGLADRVLALDALAVEIRARLREARAVVRPPGADEKSEVR